MSAFTIEDEDSIVFIITSEKLSGSIDSSNLSTVIQTNILLNAEIVIDPKFGASAQNAENSTYLIVRRTTIEPVLRTEIMASTGATTVKLAHNNTNHDDAFAVGMALNDANAGQKVEILIMGVISDPAFATFHLNSTIFLDTYGATTDTMPKAPDAIAATIIGRSFGNGEVFVNVQRPIFL